MRRALLGVLAWFALAIVFTWPLGNLMSPVLARHDDALFSVWRLAWVAHQLPRDVTHLFDTNVFFPEPNTLAYSDAMLLLGVLGAPAIWLGVPPIIVHNLLVITAFVAAALAMMRLMAYFTQDPVAQTVSALVFAFAPFRATHVVHLELLWTAFIPLALLAMYRMLERPTARRGVAFGAAVGLQGLCSIYYVVFLTIWLAAAFALSPLHVAIRWSTRHVLAFAVAIATALLLLSPYAVPYAQARDTLGPRADHDISTFSAAWSDYARASMHNRTYPPQFRATDDEHGLTIGVIATSLAVLGVVLARNRTVLAMVLLTALAVDLSLGTNGVLLEPLRRVFPPIDGFRALARSAVLTLLGASLLCGIAVASLLASKSAVQRRVVAGVLGLMMLGEYWIAPVATYDAPLRARSLETWLAAQPRVVVAAVPFPPPNESTGYETVFQYLSTFHWQPMVNGYSGHAPPRYLQLTAKMQDFPSAAAVQALRDHAVQLVIFMERYTSPEQFDGFLYACHNRAWFSEVQMFSEERHGRAAACRLAY